MKSTGANLTGTAIPFVWRLRLMLHGVRLSRLGYDELTTGCDDEPVIYRVAMVDQNLGGIDSAPLVVRINLRAASFVLRAFAQRSAEILADSSGALVAIHCASDGACHPIPTHSTKSSELVAINHARDPVAPVPIFRTAAAAARPSSPSTAASGRAVGPAINRPPPA